MTPPDNPPITGVSGGAGGIDARLDDMETTSALIGGVAVEMTELAVVSHGHLADGNVLSCALLDPVGAGRFEFTLLGALDGPGGLTAVAISVGVSAVKLKVAAVSYRTTDELQARFMDAAEFALAPVTFAAALAELTAATVDDLDETDGLAAALQKAITDHPGIVDALVGSVPGLLAQLAAVNPIAGLAWNALGRPMTVPEGAAGLARLYPDGSPRIEALGIDDDPRSAIPPRSISDVIRGLTMRNDRNGEIDVRIVESTGADGRTQRSVIVDIPGTKTWNLPGADTDVIQDLGTNLHSVANETTSMERAIALALAEAGVPPGSRDPVMLVGHSQGGIVALHAAGDLSQSGDYNVTHVLTAGSPVGEVQVPESIQVLSIENAHDVIPHLDSRDNPDQSNWTTVTVDRQLGTVGENHALRSAYEPIAESVDASDDPSVRAYADSAQIFFDGDSVTTQRIGVSRAP
jgi:hypothetical protein